MQFDTTHPHIHGWEHGVNVWITTCGSFFPKYNKYYNNSECYFRMQTIAWNYHVLCDDLVLWWLHSLRYYHCWTQRLQWALWSYTKPYLGSLVALGRAMVHAHLVITHKKTWFLSLCTATRVEFDDLAKRDGLQETTYATICTLRTASSNDSGW